jgi:hypothetical protein
MSIETGTELMRRATVEDLVAQRNKALAAYSEAHGSLVSAAQLLDAAGKEAARVCPGESRYNHHLDGEKNKFHLRLQPGTHPDYAAFVRRMVDTDAWAYVIQLTKLHDLMDRTAKDQFNQQLLKDPPEFTVDNVTATLQQFAADSGTIFKRGIAECFSKLDRRFRSHDGWKVGNRIILTYAFTEFGSWNYNRNHDDSLRDVERVFRVLDGADPTYCEILHRVQTDRGREFRAKQSVSDTEYFRVRAYMNGNAHIWFKRDDLVDRVNQLIGEYYGAPIPEDRDPHDDGGLFDAKTTPAKRYGFFPTPEPAVKHFLRDVPLLAGGDYGPALRILEPSAGTGNLARACMAKPNGDEVCNPERYHRRHSVDCVEVQPELADALRADRRFAKVYTADFLQLKPETTGLYDRIVMNPPFDRERDIDHVMHALQFLKPDGFLAAIMSAGTELRSTRKSKAFRELMNKMDAKWQDMPDGSFSSVGTNCNTGALYVWKNGAASSRYGRAAFRDFN